MISTLSPAIERSASPQIPFGDLAIQQDDDGVLSHRVACQNLKNSRTVRWCSASPLTVICIHISMLESKPPISGWRMEPNYTDGNGWRQACRSCIMN